MAVQSHHSNIKELPPREFCLQRGRGSWTFSNGSAPFTQQSCWEGAARVLWPLHPDETMWSHQWRSWKYHSQASRHLTHLRLRSSCAFSYLPSPISWLDPEDAEALEGANSTRWEKPTLLNHQMENIPCKPRIPIQKSSGSKKLTSR